MTPKGHKTFRDHLIFYRFTGEQDVEAEEVCKLFQNITNGSNAFAKKSFPHFIKHSLERSLKGEYVLYACENENNG